MALSRRPVPSAEHEAMTRSTSSDARYFGIDDSFREA